MFVIAIWWVVGFILSVIAYRVGRKLGVEDTLLEVTKAFAVVPCFSTIYAVVTLIVCLFKSGLFEFVTRMFNNIFGD